MKTNEWTMADWNAETRRTIREAENLDDPWVIEKAKMTWGPRYQKRLNEIKRERKENGRANENQTTWGFWKDNIDATLHTVRVACAEAITAPSVRTVQAVYQIH